MIEFNDNNQIGYSVKQKLRESKNTNLIILNLWDGHLQHLSEWYFFHSFWKVKDKNTFQLLISPLSLFSCPFEQQQLICSPEEKRSLGSEKNTFMSYLKKRNSLLKQSLCCLIVFKWKKEKSVLVVWKMMNEKWGLRERSCFKKNKKWGGWINPFQQDNL